jgi:hypothetical protein
MSNFAFKLWIEKQPFPKTLVGFDIGTKSTGVSITSSDLKYAFVLPSLLKYLNTLKGDILSKRILSKATSLILK